MNTILKYIIPFLMLFSSVQALVVERYLPDSLENVQVYYLKKLGDLKQLSLKGKNLNVEIIGVEGDRFEIYSNHKLAGFPTQNGSAEDYSFDFEEFFQDFYRYSSDKAAGKGNRQSVELGGEATLQDAAAANFALFDLSRQEREISLDFPKLQGSNDTPVKIIVPRSLALNIRVKKGDVKLENIDNDLFVRGKQLNIDIEDLKGVFNYNNMSGNVRIRNFDGVSTIKILTGEIDFKNMSGDLKVNNSAGDFKMKKFDGKLTLDTKVGDIDIEELRGSDVAIDTKSGDIKLKNFTDCRNIEIQTSSGEVSVENSTMKILKIRSDGGVVNIKNSRARYDIRLKAGDIYIDADKLDLSGDNFVSLDYGDIVLDLKEMEAFDFYKTSGDEKLILDELRIFNERGMKIAWKGKLDHFMNLSVNSGKIVVR